jgi:TRAP-type C4-dicarboxylate transport system permease small subunit
LASQANDGAGDDNTVPPPSLPERLIGRLTRFGAAVAAALVLFTLAVTGYAVVLRYVLGTPLTWADELSGYLVVAIVMFGAADSLLRGEHISVDLLTGKFDGLARRIVDLWSMLAAALFACALAYSGYLMLRFSIGVDMYSEGYLEVAMWKPQAPLIIGAVLIVLAALARIITLLRAMRRE